MINLMNPERRVLHLGVAAVAATVAAAGGGCGGAEPPPPPPVTRAEPPPPPPPKPKVTPISQLMAELGIDERVRLPEDKAPATDAQRRAVLTFFDGFARGDAPSVRSMLDRLDQRELDELVTEGTWKKTTSSISVIDLQCGQGDEGPAALAVFEVGMQFQPQLWYYTADDLGATFEAVATPPDIMNRLMGTDWIAAWFQLVKDEYELAMLPEQEFKPDQKDYSEPGGYDTGPSTSPSGPSNRPSGPGAPGKRPKPSGPKRRPPGPPG